MVLARWPHDSTTENSVGGSDVGAVGVREVRAEEMDEVRDWKDGGTCWEGGGVRLGGFGGGGWEERTWAVVGGDWAVRATTAMSYVSAWDVRAEFVDITSAIVAE